MGWDRPRAERNHGAATETTRDRQAARGKPTPERPAVSARRNLLICGLGGVIAPFIGIKLIDLVVHNLLGA